MSAEAGRGRGPTDRALRPIECEEAVRLVYEFLDGELDADSIDRIRRHLEVCRRCYPYFDFERTFLDHIRGVGAGERRSEELERKVRELLRDID